MLDEVQSDMVITKTSQREASEGEQTTLRRRIVALSMHMHGTLNLWHRMMFYRQNSLGLMGTNSMHKNETGYSTF